MKKQIVFIMTDTMRYDMIGCNGKTGLKTPNLDRLVAEGVNFNRAYTTQPVCGPARSAIFTGMYPHSNGAWGNAQALYSNVHTVCKRMRDHGIETGYIGKWHLDGGDYFGNGICPEGCNPKYWYDMRTYLYELSIEERFISRQIETSYKENGIEEEFTYAHRCTERALEFLEEFSEEDFFLTVSYDEPHGPCLSPKPFAGMYEDYCFPKAPNIWDTLEDKPEYQRLWANKAVKEDKDVLEIRHQAFFDCNSYVDYEIGRVLKEVEKLAPDALIVYTSDHGDMLMSHCLNGKACGVYDEMARIPLVVKGPEIPQGKCCSNTVSHISLTPTFLKYMGIDAPSPIEGESILSLFLNPDSQQKNDPVFIEFGRFENIHDCVGGLQLMRCVFDGRYKLAINLNDIDELYDLEKDPYEMKNLINDPDYSDERNLLHDILLEHMNITRDPFRGYHWGRRTWRKDYLPLSGDLWNGDNISRQRNIVGYEPNQLEYWTGLEVLDFDQLNYCMTPERIARMITEQKKREENKNTIEN